MAITVADLANALGAEAAGNLDLRITGPAEPSTATDTQVALAMNKEFLEALPLGKAKVALLSDGADWQALGLEAAIFAPRPRYALAGVNRVFEKAPNAAQGIHPTAVIDSTAEIGENASIGPFVVIGRGARVGANARILSHVTISEDARIGDDALIFSGVRIGARVVIGDRFIAQPNAAIGGDGFSFVTPKPGAIEEVRSTLSLKHAEEEREFVRINSLGSVRIGDDVEIGANSTVDRGTISDTEIGSGTKLDNLVQIGHNVKIGKTCLLCGLVGVAGSVKIGDRVILGGQTGVADHVIIGDGVVTGGSTGIASNIPPNSFMMGSPAVKMETYVESYKLMRRLPRLLDKLQKQVSNAAANK